MISIQEIDVRQKGLSMQVEVRYALGKPVSSAIWQH